MFCGKCGTQMADNERYCPNCGAPVEESGPELKGDTGSSNNAKKIGIIVVAVAVVAIIILVICLIPKSSGYTKNLNNMAKAFNNADPELLMTSMYKGTTLQEEYEDLDKDDWEDAKDSMEDLLDEWEDEYGKNVKITIEATKEKKLEGSKFEDAAEVLEDNDYFDDADDIKQIVELRLELTIKGKDDDDTEKISGVYAVKTKAGWSIILYPQSDARYAAYNFAG